MIQYYSVMFENLFARRGLSLERLRTLVEVHDAGSIAQAVPGNLVRHSQYSRQLRELSEFFGRELVHRSGKAMKVTAEGERLVETSREFMKALDDLSATFRTERVMFTVAAGDSLIQWLVVPRLGAVMSEFPGVGFATERARTHEIIQRVSELRVDFGLVRKDAVVPGLRTAPMGSLSYAAVVPTSLAAKRKGLTLEDVFKMPVALQETDGQFSKQVVEIARAVVPTFRPAVACQSFPQTMAAVRSGYVAAILPELALTEFAPGTVQRVVGPALQKLKREIMLVWSKRMMGVRPLASRVGEGLSRSFRFA
jgi:DNA-binding transcriptional LysR family regulator